MSTWSEISLVVFLSLVLQEPERLLRSRQPQHQVRAGLAAPRPQHRQHRHARTNRQRRHDHSRILHRRRPGSPRGGPFPWRQRIQLRELVRRQRGARRSPRELPSPAAVQSGRAPQPVGQTDEAIGGVGHMMGAGLQPMGGGC